MKNFYAMGQQIKNYQLKNLLSKGDHSEVWASLSSQGDICALKIFVSEYVDSAKKEYNNVLNFKHPNILSPIAFLSDEKINAMVLPYCQGRSVDAVAGFIDETLLWQLIRDVSGALRYIHSQGWIHLNIAPSNILWNGTSFLLTDFGTCTAADVATDGIVVENESYQYAAPERVSKPSYACDIWSLGATVFHLFMGCHVFNGLGGSVQQSHSPLPYMRKTMPAMSELVMACLEFNPSDRPTASTIFEKASEEIIKLQLQQKVRLQKPRALKKSHDYSCEFWPDDMIE